MSYIFYIFTVNLKLKIMTRTQLVSEMAKALKDNYDCIMKLDAIKWLKDLYPTASLTLRINAYHLAYED